MAYSKNPTWVAFPSTSTPVTAAKLNNIENGIEATAIVADAALAASAAPELIRDTMGTALVAGTNVTITPNDVGDTITIAATAGSAPDATTGSKGVVQLAGDLGGTAAAPTVVASSATVAGKVELATSAETITGTDTVRAVTPAGLAAKVSSETAQGIVELATAAETTTGTDNTRAVHPAGLKVELDKKQPLSTLTTKGDIYVATGSATVTRLAVGSNNQVLTADSAQASGVKWATPAAGGSGAGTWTGGSRSLFTSGSGSGTGDYIGAQPAGNRVVWVRAYMPACTIVSLSVNVTTGGDGASIIRFGIYADSAGGMEPAARLLSAGTVSTTSTGVKTLSSLTHAHAGGYVWIGLAAQGHTSSPCQVTTDANFGEYHGAIIGTPNWGYPSLSGQESVSSTLPNPAAPDVFVAGAPRVLIGFTA